MFHIEHFIIFFFESLQWCIALALSQLFDLVIWNAPNQGLKAQVIFALLFFYLYWFYKNDTRPFIGGIVV